MWYAPHTTCRTRAPAGSGTGVRPQAAGSAPSSSSEGGAWPSWPYESSPAVKRRAVGAEEGRVRGAARELGDRRPVEERGDALGAGAARGGRRRRQPELAGGALAPRVDEALARRGERVRAARRHVEHHLLGEALDRRRRRQVGGAADAELAVAAGAPREERARRRHGERVAPARGDRADGAAAEGARRQRRRRVDARREPPGSPRRPDAWRPHAWTVPAGVSASEKPSPAATAASVVLERAQPAAGRARRTRRALRPPPATAPLAARDASPAGRASAGPRSRGGGST